VISLEIGKAVHIREWREDDFDLLHALDCACFPPPIAYSRRTLRKFLRLPGAHCLVGETGGRIAGFILTHAESPSTVRRARIRVDAERRGPLRGHIISLDVDPRFRRGGVGSALLHAAEESLVSNGVDIVDLETAVDNQPGVAFWRRHGYEIASTIADYYDAGVDAFAMFKAMPRELHGQSGASSLAERRSAKRGRLGPAMTGSYK